MYIQCNAQTLSVPLLNFEKCVHLYNQNPYQDTELSIKQENSSCPFSVNPDLHLLPSPQGQKYSDSFPPP